MWANRKNPRTACIDMLTEDAIKPESTGMVTLYLHPLHSAYLANDREAIRHLRGA